MTYRLGPVPVYFRHCKYHLAEVRYLLSLEAVKVSLDCRRRILKVLRSKMLCILKLPNSAGRVQNYEPHSPA